MQKVDAYTGAYYPQKPTHTVSFDTFVNHISDYFDSRGKVFCQPDLLNGFDDYFRIADNSELFIGASRPKGKNRLDRHDADDAFAVKIPEKYWR